MVYFMVDNISTNEIQILVVLGFLIVKKLWIVFGVRSLAILVPNYAIVINVTQQNSYFHN